MIDYRRGILGGIAFSHGENTRDGLAANSPIRQEFKDEWRRPVCQAKPLKSTRNRKRQILKYELTQQMPSICANRNSDGKLASSFLRSRKKEPCDIGANYH